jgi:predicted AAA+ superfamily ATPase
MESAPRFLVDPGRSFFLFGPRGTGKSTWTRQAYPHALRVDLLRPDVVRSLQAHPERLLGLVKERGDRQVVVIDEVQRVPELLSLVHLLIEEQPGLRFVLTGSSARKLKRAGVDLLAGRASRKSLHPFMAAELGDGFDLGRALRLGLIPLVVASPDPEEALAGYVSLYLNEEVQAEGLVRNVPAFARFLESVSFSHATVLNTSNVARECEVERKTVEGYLQILEDLLLAWRLPVFTRRAQRALACHPKFFLVDAGVFRSLRPSGPLDQPEALEGAALEGLVGQHLRAWLDYRGQGGTLSYWRTRGGVEVDFVVYGPGTFLAVEVKNTTRVRPEDLRGLKAFAQDYPEAERILAYRGEEALEINGIRCLPCERFLRGLGVYDRIVR